MQWDMEPTLREQMLQGANRLNLIKHRYFSWRQQANRAETRGSRHHVYRMEPFPTRRPGWKGGVHAQVGEVQAACPHRSRSWTPNCAGAEASGDDFALRAGAPAIRKDARERDDLQQRIFAWRGQAKAIREIKQLYEQGSGGQRKAVHAQPRATRRQSIKPTCWSAT
jgi:hypothetical protein